MNLNYINNSFYAKSKNRVLILAIIYSFIFSILSCDSMDSNYKDFLKYGEIIYPGKADSAKVHPGNYRTKLSWLLLSDPTITKSKIFWNNYTDSMEVAIDRTKGIDTIDVIINNLEERIYTFVIYNFDSYGNMSIPSEISGPVYGDKFLNTLSNRSLKNFDYNDNEGLSLEWYNAEDTEISSILTYTDISEKTQTKNLAKSDTITFIPDYKLGEPLYCSTMHKPDSLAIDSFSVSKQRVELQAIVNVALNKPVTASNVLGNYVAENAVDGDKSTKNKRWITQTGVYTEHWLEIDLKESYSIHAFSLWRQVYQQFMPMWRFQVWIDDEWVTVIDESNAPATGTSPHHYYKEFEPVTTEKVRWYLPAYENNTVRMFEIEVFSNISY